MSSSSSYFSSWVKKVTSICGLKNEEIIFQSEADVAEKAEKENRVLMMYKDNVYDCTKYLDAHPGGKQILLQAKGKIVDKVFDKYHYPLGDAPKIMKKYLIGKIVRDQPESTINSKNPAVKPVETSQECVKPFPQEQPSKINISDAPTNCSSTGWDASYTSDVRSRSPQFKAVGESLDDH